MALHADIFILVCHLLTFDIHQLYICLKQNQTGSYCKTEIDKASES